MQILCLTSMYRLRQMGVHIPNYIDCTSNLFKKEETAEMSHEIWWKIVCTTIFPAPSSCPIP